MDSTEIKAGHVSLKGRQLTGISTATIAASVNVAWCRIHAENNRQVRSKLFLCSTLAQYSELSTTESGSQLLKDSEQAVWTVHAHRTEACICE